MLGACWNENLVLLGFAVRPGKVLQLVTDVADVPTFSPQLALSSEHGYLRPYRIEDADTVFAAVRESIETVSRWMPWCHAGYAEAESIAWIERCLSSWQTNQAYEFGMFDAANEYLGGAGINQLDPLNKRANLGYWVRESRQKQGFATAATRALAHFGFATLGLTRVEIVAASENTASRRVAEKAGANFECLARNRLVIHGVPVSAAVYSLVPNVDA